MKKRIELSEMLRQPVFFKPNTEFIKWLIEYANNRLIIDAGCGEKFLLSQQLLNNGYKKIMAIDPVADYNEVMKLRTLNKIPLDSSFHVLPQEIERYKEIYTNSKAASKSLVIFARPCHSDWVENLLDEKAEGLEVLYITVPKNIELYDDLGKWKKKAVLLNHKGSSADNEVVYSIK